jgi:hypothetical protein
MLRGVPIAAKLHHNRSPSLARTVWQVDINYCNCRYGGTAHNQIQILPGKWKIRLNRTQCNESTFRIKATAERHVES